MKENILVKMQQTFNEINENDTLVAISYAKQMSEDYTKAVYLQKQKEKDMYTPKNIIDAKSIAKDVKDDAEKATRPILEEKNNFSRVEDTPYIDQR